MIRLLSQELNFDATAETVPEELVSLAQEASRKITDPHIAKLTLEKLTPALKYFQPDRDFCVACGLIIEKQRKTEGMLDFWMDLRKIFPEDKTTLRMMMRWFRRERRTDAGIATLHRLFPNSHSDLEQAEAATMGFAELKAFEEVDHLMAAILPLYTDARALRMRYVRVLNQQSRYLDAQAIADTVNGVDKMGASSRALIDTAYRRAAKMSQLYTRHAADVFTRIIDTIPHPDPIKTNALGAVTFYSGQLGTGGAERQMARIAGALQTRFQNGQPAGGLALTAPFDVAVRHTTPESGADFYVPTLRQAGVETTSVSTEPEVALTDLQGVPSEIINLLELLPEDVFEITCRMIQHFQDRKTQVAYLWQDGGVLFAALAALIAGVPRIVTSFRGLPPNMRPNLYRPELPVLYAAMAKLPHVTFTANSQVAATAYEDWLKLSSGMIGVIPNAMLPVLPDGSDVDEADWQAIFHKSAQCDQTVLGVFRFDENKRPLLWIDVAAAYLRTHPNTRFIMIGSGYLFAQCVSKVEALGLQNRIFLTGVRENVGFYMHRADVVMHLARMEGLPNVLIEAQLAGVPVLATPAGGTAEVVSSGITGHILPCAEDPQISEVSRALAGMLRAPDHLKTMGEAAQKQATPRFLIDNILDRTTQHFVRPEGTNL